MDIGGWLRTLGLERYEAAFRENEIDDTILPRLTAEDLKELGVRPVGHRRKHARQTAIAKRRSRTGSSSPRIRVRARLVTSNNDFPGHLLRHLRT